MAAERAPFVALSTRTSVRTVYDLSHIRTEHSVDCVLQDSHPRSYRHHRQLSSSRFIGESHETMLALTFVLFFIFIFDSRAVGDFRAEFCNRPIARTPRPFGLILRLLIRRAVYRNTFLNAAKEANRTKQWAFKVWARAAKRRFLYGVSVPSGSCPIQHRAPQE